MEPCNCAEPRWHGVGILARRWVPAGTHLLLEQALSPRRKGSCHQPTNTTPRSSGDHRACATAGLIPQPQAGPLGAPPLQPILTWPGERCSGTPSSTERLLPSRSRAQRTGTLRVLSASPQSSRYTNCSPCGTAPSAPRLAVPDTGLCAQHARGVRGTLMGCTACSRGAWRADGARATLAGCTARSRSTLTGHTTHSWGAQHAHGARGTHLLVFVLLCWPGRSWHIPGAGGPRFGPALLSHVEQPCLRAGPGQAGEGPWHGERVPKPSLAQAQPGTGAAGHATLACVTGRGHGAGVLPSV